MLVDEAQIYVTSGKGGNGAVSFNKQKYQPKGRPDGGDGGRGGSVVLEAHTGTSSLGWIANHPHQKAKPGVHGSRSNKTGASADDLILQVPPGTIVKSPEGDVLADLAAPGDRVTVARGGRGGRGNARMVAPNRRAPGFAELGEPGEELTLRLELRMIADVAIIGLPNAGKSTLVSAISRARPKIADYPFTTLEPSLGVVERNDEVFTVCDVPGLIEGAHEGKGLGLKFLRHAMRSAVFVHVVDLASGEDPLAAFDTVARELEEFRKDLALRPVLVALNKIDAVDSQVVEEARAAFRARDPELAVLAISSAEQTGLGELTARLADLVSHWRREHSGPQGFELFRTEPDKIRVEREPDGAWRVAGGSVVRWVAMTDLSNPEAVVYLQNRMERAGVEDLLGEAGAVHGDEVRIGSSSFSWWPKGSAPLEAFDLDGEIKFRGGRG